MRFQLGLLPGLGRSHPWIRDKGSVLRGLKLFYVYLVKSKTRPRMFKIGRSANPYERLRSLQTGSPVELELVGFVACKSQMHMCDQETGYHRKYARSRRKGEWFQLSNRDFCKLEIEMNAGMLKAQEQERGERLNSTLDSDYKRIFLEF